MNENMSENTRALGFLPPLGWNSWNTFTWDINESLIFEIADCMVRDGYKDAGYEYLVIDDCWSLKERNENGHLVADPKKFPHGMKAVADYIHDKGLKFGMYSCAGTHTCAGYPGSLNMNLRMQSNLRILVSIISNTISALSQDICPESFFING